MHNAAIVETTWTGPHHDAMRSQHELRSFKVARLRRERPSNLSLNATCKATRQESSTSYTKYCHICFTRSWGPGCYTSSERDFHNSRPTLTLTPAQGWRCEASHKICGNTRYPIDRGASSRSWRSWRRTCFAPSSPSPSSRRSSYDAGGNFSCALSPCLPTRQPLWRASFPCCAGF